MLVYGCPFFQDGQGGWGEGVAEGFEKFVSRYVFHSSECTSLPPLQKLHIWRVRP